MSGHSKWATTHRKKEVADAKKGAVFTKLANLISLAARKGVDLESNFQLRLMVEKARAANMPKDNIDRAIKRGSGEGGEGNAPEEVIYEIIGPKGSAFIAEAITDNKNRTVATLKSALNKSGGQLGSPNSALWMFERQGVITANAKQLAGWPAPAGQDLDEWELKIIDAGAEDIERGEETWEIYTATENLQELGQNLKTLGLEIKESRLTYVAKNDLPIKDPPTQEKIERLYAAIDDLDDINNIYTNANW